LKLKIGLDFGFWILDFEFKKNNSKTKNVAVHNESNDFYLSAS